MKMGVFSDGEDMGLEALHVVESTRAGQQPVWVDLHPESSPARGHLTGNRLAYREFDWMAEGLELRTLRKNLGVDCLRQRGGGKKNPIRKQQML
ncbi:hypothetical protein chiPu_0003898 [Chiloscyllium punctatum]|uniref:Uncharacterized protein n=1 Tax=Chiloscyllium punctatum TaxID=137246 RepID=A0A401S533_CHIPU|nr:hypothetical protein [Chiloscyllium punctatum]